MFIIAALAAMSVGIFTENNILLHTIASIGVFLFCGLSAIFSSKVTKSPFNIIAILLGVISLITIALFMGNIYLGLGKGGMERMIVYPILVWMLGFASFLIAYPKNHKIVNKYRFKSLPPTLFNLYLKSKPILTR